MRHVSNVCTTVKRMLATTTHSTIIRLIRKCTRESRCNWLTEVFVYFVVLDVSFRFSVF